MDLGDIINGQKPLAVVRKPIEHDSAAKHVTGDALYVDDLIEPSRVLHAAPGYAPIAAGRATRVDLEAVKKAPGVVDVLTAEDVPGVNDISPKQIGDDPAITADKVMFYGQVLFVVLAETRDQARRAVRLARISTAPGMPVIDVDDALVAETRIHADYSFVRGDPAEEISRAPKEITGELRMGGQEHFYLEGQAALAIPGEDGDMMVYSSTQHPSEVQHVVAHVLGLDSNQVTVEVRRMGGGFGGKESQATQWAVLAALGARKTGRPCKIRLDRDDDMIMTGKRHDFRVDYHGVPCRRGLLLPDVSHRHPADADQHGVEHRVPRIRRPAREALRRADDGPHRLCDRPRPARCAQGQYLRRGRSGPYPVQHAGRGQHPPRNHQRSRAN
jgi:xanthine dehydrogenase large subunit